MGISEPSRGNMCENNWIRGKNISVCPASQFYPSNITKQKTGWQPYKWVTSRVLIKQVMCRLGKGSAESFVQNARNILKRRALEKTSSKSTSEVCGYLRGINEERECGKCEYQCDFCDFYKS